MADGVDPPPADSGFSDASDAAIRSFFENAPVMMLILNENKRVQMMNGAARQALNHPTNDPGSDRFGNVIHCIHSRESPDGCGSGEACRECSACRLLADTFESGESRCAVEVCLDVGREAKSPARYFLISTSLLSWPEGRKMLVSVEDITGRKRAEEQLRANLRIQRAIGAILRASLGPESLEEILQRVLELLVSLPWLRLQSKGAVFLWEPESETLLMAAQIGLPHETVSTCRRVKAGACLCGRAAATQQIVFASSVDDLHSIPTPGMTDHAHYCVPIVSEGQLYGVLTLYLIEGHPRQSEEEAFLSAVSDVLATTIQRRRAEQSLEESEGQLKIAQRIQRHLLPASAPAIPDFDIAGALYPAEYAAGDHFDYLKMSDGGLGIVVGDVSGHGFAPALLMASVCARLRSFSEIGMGIGEMASRLNAALVRETEDEHFVTAFLGRLDPIRRTLTYVNAGHLAGYVLNASGSVKAEMSSTGLPLAVLPDADLPLGSPVTLEPGDIVLLLTDGVLEARSPEGKFFGIENALGVVRGHRMRPAGEIIKQLYGAVCDFSQRSLPEDDITAVVIKLESRV